MREQFLAALFNGPILWADVVVVFSGDGRVRVDTALAALKQGAAHHCLVMGGLDNPPHSLRASTMRHQLIEGGLAPDRILMDGTSQNTHEQAEALAREIIGHEWTRVLLVASPYHMPRAFLTVLASLKAAELDEIVQVVPMPAHCKWWEHPDGLERTRMDLLTDEFAKIEKYGDHVASYADGLAYLEEWE